MEEPNMNGIERARCVWTVLLWGAVAACAPGITYTPFEPQGDGGTVNGQAIIVGAGGTVYEFCQYLYVAGLDLNGTNVPGTSARLVHDAPPPGITISFAPQLSSNTASLLLTYSITNSGSNVYQDVRFFSYLDSEIDQDLNTFYNEYGSTTGTPGRTEWDPAPDFWQIDEPGFPGFEGGNLVENLLKGTADGTNHVPMQSPNDVSMALGFRLGDLGPGTGRTVRVQISEDGAIIGGFGLENRDSAPSSTTRITFSGAASVTIQDGSNVFANVTEAISNSWTWVLDRQTGTFKGSLRLEGRAGQHFTAPWQLSMSPSNDFRFMQASGTNASGNAYVDFGGDAVTALGAAGNHDAVLDGDESVTVPNFEVYSRYRVLPPSSLFQVWANQFQMR